ncbi:D-alanine--D-alanine ligase [Ciceribacter sp. RN22]|uniref:D-alanine--D-alanine ligase n=1 Tax=Ciceribacter sp. RN22 TaxID=2954932 RepID=UPI0020938DBE|nr:D-alanine--D-alanine ligase [Ciceribacter sp. RN22]MCO6180789.1 D-alanine--D-alanine ligase [Ciceribacter sp. RN22]
MKHVVVLFGGASSERDVSLKSGQACAGALKEIGYTVSTLDVTENVVEALQSLRPDVVFNALHGPMGEDGRIQGLLEYLKFPYTHSGVLASALAMNKAKAKEIMQAAGIPVADGRLVDRRDAAREHPMSAPYVLKPVSEGSSLGVLIVRDDKVPPPQMLVAPEWRYGDIMLAERYVGGRELTCGVMHDRALDIIEIRSTFSHVADFSPTTGQFYDYQAKYSKGGSVHELPARIDPVAYRQIQQWALEAHGAIGCRGVTRTDFRYDDGPDGTGEIVALEINTQPGMTETSLVPEMAASAGISFPELVRWMIEDASLNR